MKKINFNSIMISLSIILFTSVALIRIYLSNISWYISTILLIISNICILLTFISSQKIKKKKLLYVVLCLMIFLPSLYNNAHLEDRMYNTFFPTLLSITYVILLHFSNYKDEHTEIIYKYFIVFATLTSIVTWISFFSPNFYVSKIIPLLPISEQIAVRNNFLIDGMRMGLSNHYSRNAFFIVLGIIAIVCKLFAKNKNTKKFSIIMLIFFFASLFLVGKRAHLLFLLASLVLAYFIYNKISLKTTVKFIGIAIIFVLFVILCINFIPGTQNIVERLLNVSGVDFSSGRFSIYELAWNIYKNNDFVPIGWGQFSKSTGYAFTGVHNDFLQLICEVGPLGLILIIGSNIIIFFKSVKLSHVYKSGISFGILVYNIFFMIYSMTGIPHYDLETYMIYLLFNCILFYHLEKVKTNERRLS